MTDTRRESLGVHAGQPSLGDIDGPRRVKRDFGVAPGVLPELSEAETRTRPLWRHPAFLLSIGLTTVVLIVAAVLIIMSLLAPPGARVSGLEIEIAGGNAHLTWTSDADVDLYVVTGGETTDLSQAIRGREAWILVGLGLYDDSSCFILRPAARADDELSLGAEELAAQGAQSVCVADAESGGSGS